MPDYLHLKAEHRAAVDRCLKWIAQSNPKVSFVAILVGSVARGTDSERSDLDVVLLSATPLQVKGCDPIAHVQAFMYDSFAEKLRTGDDFAAWCVRLGVPILGDLKKFQAIASSVDASIWPDWKHKVPHATRRLILAEDMRLIGDSSAASEETLYAAAHIARAILLRAGVFPLSRPEMVAQLDRENHVVLAELLRRLVLHDEEPRFLNRAVRYLKRVLIDLDKATFGSLAEKHLLEAAKRAAARRSTDSRVS